MSRRHFARFVALLAVCLGFALVQAPMASATPILNPHPTCSGSSVAPGGYDWIDGGTKIGTMYLYYSSANGGSNCAWFQKTRYRGTETFMFLDIWACGSTPSTDCTIVDFDGGDFASYAGRVDISGNMAGRCVQVTMTFKDAALGRNREKTWGPFHCG